MKYSNSSQSNSKSEDTSLDDIFAPLIDSPNLTLTSVYWYEAKQSILAWHKAERAKLFEQIRSEVIGEDKPDNSFDEDYINGWNNCLAEQREALTRLEKNEKVTE